MSTAPTKDRMVTMRESDALRAMPGLNPQALIAAAIDKGAGIETLERLVQLAKDVRAITAKEAYDEAMSEFQRRCPSIKKNREMVIPGRPIYKYSDLAEILKTIAPLEGELGLSHSWRAVKPEKPNAVATICKISHKFGHSEESGPCEIPYTDSNRMNGAQTVGSAKTYAKRYSLEDVLGISAEDDDDAGSTGKDDVKSTRQADRPRSSAEDRRPAESGSNPGARETSSPDPNDPALVAESENLFQTPDVIRDPLIKRIEKFTPSKIKVALHRVLSVDPEMDWRTKLDPAAMDMLAKHLEVK
jgi:hypothetical protein